MLNCIFYVHRLQLCCWFQVSEATEILKTALEHLDELTDGALGELEMILYDEEPGLRQEILGVMNKTLANIHITLLDVGCEP